MVWICKDFHGVKEAFLLKTTFGKRGKLSFTIAI